jgi:YihY family inner membrane protein
VSSDSQPTAPPQGRAQTWRDTLVPCEPEYDPSRIRRAYLLCIYVLRRWIVEDRGGGMAAVLTIHTLLSTVPLIGVALLLLGLMDDSAGARLMHDTFRAVVPETSRAEDMARAALELASNVTITNLGAWGFLVTLLIAFVLFQTLERTFNRIWRVTRKRNVLVKFTIFYTLATLGPLLMLYSFAQPLLPTARGLPLVTTIISLVLLNRLLPFTNVRWRGALLGGLVSAILFELGKKGFGLYTTRVALQTYEGLYGSLAMLPILVVWSFLSWMVILLGAQIAFTVQRRRPIALQGYLNRYLLDRLDIQRPSSRTAARMLLAICDQYAKRQVGLGPDALTERFGVGLDLVNDILSRLEAANLVVETDRPSELFVPARPLDQIRLLDVVALFDKDHTRHAREDRLTEVFEQLDADRLELIATTTFAELLDPNRRRLV